MTSPPRIIATLTAFNRKEKTLAALESFFRQEVTAELSAVLMDDGSTDGTSEAIRSQYPQVRLLRGDGSLFWNGGMAAAFSEACSMSGDYYLWLNDDTILDRDAVARLLVDSAAVASGNGSILVGSTRDPNTGAFTYGGVRSASRWHPGKFDLQRPGNSPIPCHAMNGNIVLISEEAARIVGGVDTRFTHSMGDYDYALRAHKAGVAVFAGAGFHGVCPRNEVGAAWHERDSFKSRWQYVNSPKGLPMREWAYFLRKHGNGVWPLAWLSTYRRIITG